jgi:hypothetical protein
MLCSQVVEIIEGIIQAPDTQLLAKLEADAAEAVALLSAMPVVNVELWAKLGRAAAARKLWATAVQCCRSAFKVRCNAPFTRHPHVGTNTADAPGGLASCSHA